LPGNTSEQAKRKPPTDLGRKDMEDFQREEELWLEIMIDGQLFVNRLQVPVGETGLSEVR